MKTRKNRLALIMTGILTVSMIAGCNSTSSADGQTEVDTRVKVKSETPQINSISIDGDFIGTVESEEQIYVVAKASGDVTETFFEVGDTVNAGDLMFTIDDTAAQIQLKQANASLTTANASLNTAKAGVNTANAAANASQASVNESFGTASTTDQQLQMAIDSAEVNFYNNEQNIGVLENTLNQLNDKVDALEKSIDGLKTAKSTAEAAYAADPTSEAKKKAATEAQSALKTAEESLNTLKNTRDQTKVSYESAKRSNCLLVENAEVARQQKSDYDNYTKATIGNAGLATLAQAQAGITQAEAGVIQSKAGITQAEAAVEAAQLQLDNTMAIAPVSGIVTAKNVTKNNMASTGTIAYTITSDSNKYVSLYVSEEVMSELSIGQIVSIDKNGTKYNAVITENPGVADSQTGLFKVRALIDSNEPIINGMKVKITMTTRSVEDTLTIPISAVYYETERAYVYKIVDGKAIKTYVTTGLFDNEKIEILEGITAQDEIITTWSSQLRNGVEVVSENSSDSASAAPAPVKAGTIIVERDDG